MGVFVLLFFVKRFVVFCNQVGFLGVRNTMVDFGIPIDGFNMNNIIHCSSIAEFFLIFPYKLVFVFGRNCDAGQFLISNSLLYFMDNFSFNLVLLNSKNIVGTSQVEAENQE